MSWDVNVIVDSGEDCFEDNKIIELVVDIVESKYSIFLPKKMSVLGSNSSENDCLFQYEFDYSIGDVRIVNDMKRFSKTIESVEPDDLTLSLEMIARRGSSAKGFGWGNTLVKLYCLGRNSAKRSFYDMSLERYVYYAGDDKKLKFCGVEKLIEELVFINRVMNAQFMRGVLPYGGEFLIYGQSTSDLSKKFNFEIENLLSEEAESSSGFLLKSENLGVYVCSKEPHMDIFELI